MRWTPWRALRSRPDVDFDRIGLPSGADAVSVAAVVDGGVVLLDHSLSRVERRCALAHEIVHLERGGGSCDPCRVREEAIVDRIVAERLVPLCEPLVFCDHLEVVEAWMVAEEFDVTDDVARRALATLDGASRLAT